MSSLPKTPRSSIPNSPHLTSLSSSYNRLASPKLNNLESRKLQRTLQNIESPKLKGLNVISPKEKISIKSKNEKFNGEALIINNNLSLQDSSSTPSSPNDIYSPEQQNDILNGYLYGQIANVAKFAIWWVCFSPLVLSLFNGNSYAIGASRACFNLALFILSPLAGVLAERVSVRKILNITTSLRGIIYVLIVPVAWLLLQSDYIIKKEEYYDNIFLFTFLICVFLDGVLVAFSNVVDIDCGGTGIVAKQYGFEVDEVVLNKFNSLHTGTFDLAMIIITPCMALAAVLIKNNSEYFNNSSVLLLVIASIFLVSTVSTLIFYNLYMPSRRVVIAALDDSIKHAERSCFDEMEDIFVNMLSGLQLCWNHKAVFWRLIFLGLETSFEDAFISLVISEFVVIGVYNNADFSCGALLSAGIVAVGKIGAVITATLMNRYWTPPSPVDANSSMTDDEKFEVESAPFKPLFGYVLAGSCFASLMPVAYYVRTLGYENWSLAIAFIASFFFFLFSTAPKIGFATLMQSLAAEADASGRIYGFVAAFITALDSLTLLGFSFLFSYFQLQVALILCSACIMIHGLLEFFVGPYLVLQKSHSNYQPLLKEEDNDP